jgi:hypothetical protein
MIFVNVRHVTKGQQVVFVELADGGFELQRLASSLQFLHDVDGADEEHAEAFSVSARPLLPAPGGPNNSRLVALSSQVSPAASAMTRALLSIGTTEKSKL